MRTGAKQRALQCKNQSSETSSLSTCPMGFAMHRSAEASAPVGCMLMTTRLSPRKYRMSPAAGLIRYFRGRHLVVINMQPTGADAQADLCIAKPIGQVLSEDVLLED